MEKLINRHDLNVIDVLKGVSILAVVLYHLGWITWGWLGVDVFFVISGYLTMLSAFRKCEARAFGFFDFMMSRIRRIYPSVSIASLVVLIVACVLMVPSALFACAKGVLYSQFFSYNFWLWHLSQDYWQEVNQHNPILHFWYVCALMQVYIVFACLMIGAVERKSLMRRCVLMAVASACCASLVFVNRFDKAFLYYCPSLRFMEFSVGVLLAWLPLAMPTISRRCHMLRFLGHLGVMSFSIYIWHQIVFAFVRYSTPWMDHLLGQGLMLVIVAVLSLAAFRIIECCRIGRMLVVVAVFVLAIAGIVTGRGGVLYAVEELGVRSKADLGMHARYNERVRTEFAGCFSCLARHKILVVGNSFARDLVNVLAESRYSKDMSIVYSSPEGCPHEETLGEEADVILVTSGEPEFDLFDRIRIRHVGSDIENSKVYVVGYKYLGKSIGRYFSRRFCADYWKQTIGPVPSEVVEANRRQAKKYGSHYFDLIRFMSVPNKENIDGGAVFTADRRFISHDCYHFSCFGAKYYADLLTANLLTFCHLNNEDIEK